LLGWIAALLVNGHPSNMRGLDPRIGLKRQIFWKGSIAGSGFLFHSMLQNW
jgi:hypothetical protein